MKDIDTLSDVRKLDEHGLMFMESTRDYNGPFWMLVRRLFLNQERRIAALEKELKELKK